MIRLLTCLAPLLLAAGDESSFVEQFGRNG